MKMIRSEDKKRNLEKQIDILFITFSVIMLFFTQTPFVLYYRTLMVEGKALDAVMLFRICRDVAIILCILLSLLLRFVFKRKIAQQLLFCTSFYIYLFSIVYTLKINFSIPFFAIMAVILLIQLIDIYSRLKTTFLIFTLILYISIGYLQLSGIVEQIILDRIYHDRTILILNSIFFGVFLIATYLLNKKTQIKVEEKYSGIVEEKLETIGQLKGRLDSSDKEVDFMQTAKAGFGNTLTAIQKENAKLYNYLKKNKQTLKYEDIYLYSYKIKDTLNKFIDTLAPEESRTGTIDYDLILDKPNYTLHIIKSGNRYKISLSATFLNIIEELMCRLISDLDNKVPVDRGFTDKIEFEKKLFQGITDSNRLNSNVTRIRKELRNLGLNPKLIETKHHKIRINTTSEKVEIIDF